MKGISWKPIGKNASGKNKTNILFLIFGSKQMKLEYMSKDNSHALLSKKNTIQMLQQKTFNNAFSVTLCEYPVFRLSNLFQSVSSVCFAI